MPLAYSDIRMGYVYYNNRQKGLGKRFESV
jgi:hypothetical protein